jgi:hypothetical protein
MADEQQRRHARIGEPNMIVIVRQAAQAGEHRRRFWAWCFENGFIATEVADPIVVDIGRGVLGLRCWIPVSQPGDPDFPELRRDEFNEPLTEARELPLAVPVPDWMVTEAGERLAA